MWETKKNTPTKGIDFSLLAYFLEALPRHEGYHIEAGATSHNNDCEHLSSETRWLRR
ncbi:hypothetical protein TanjilG_08682 [Lupinus angustifolius]|uniref:Uncharacterized protein n=1 Tax=Lupinus angustifolius TaxID=3871 RepID=A0A4P1QWX9_LUPAN|nr:hypothetical protein TanjilG_08682 [Lupinus angustifolius]